MTKRVAKNDTRGANSPSKSLTKTNGNGVNMAQVSLQFAEITEKTQGAHYSDGCSGGRSDCCTRVCTRNEANSDENSLAEWDRYLEVNAGVIQY